MKKLFLLLICLVGLQGWAQVDALSYQGVIINPDDQELPGVNKADNFLSRTDIQVRFTIIDATGNDLYQETHQTRTDRFGMFSLRIGQGMPITASLFTEINWDGIPKNLKVEVAIEGDFALLDTKELTFVPYAFHRDIFASGMMSVAGTTLFQDDLLVRGMTQLNDTLSVNNGTQTDLTGTLTVDQNSVLGGSLDVTNQHPTQMTGSLTLEGNGQLNDRLTVEGQTSLERTLEVNASTRLKTTLDVNGATTLANDVAVIEGNDTRLTGTLTVEGETNLNSDVTINNGGALNLSGDLTVSEATVIDGTMTVNRFTNLNKNLSVNNGEPTAFTGMLLVDGQTTLEDSLFVSKETNLENVLRVNNQMPTYLSGTLQVDLATTLNSALNVNNGSNTELTGPLNVQGMIDFGNDLTVAGRTNFNDDLFVNNNATTAMSGPLRVNGATFFADQMVVDGATTFNNDITVTNGSATLLTGTLRTDGATTLQNTLAVLNSSSSALGGSLAVDDITTLNSELEVTNSGSTFLSGLLDVTATTSFGNTVTVTNAAATQLTGLLDVTEMTTFNDLSVVNTTPTLLTGTLNVDGVATLNDAVTINGFTSVNSDLTVSGLADLQNLVARNFDVSDDQTGAVATFSSTDLTDSQGMVIKLGKTHPRYLGGVFIGAQDVGNDGAPSPAVVDMVKKKFQPGMVNLITPDEMFNLIPDLIALGALPDINNFVFEEINARLSGVGFPGMDFPNYDFPDVPGFPGTSEPGVIFPGIQFYGGFSGGCSGQACFSICFPFVGCTTVCIPPVNICLPPIPAIGFPEIRLNGFNLTPPIPNLIPSLPGLGTPALTDVFFPLLPDEIVFDALTNDNEYAVFQDADGRVLGSIRAESIQDFFGRTIDNDVYMVNVLSEFVGLDLAKVKAKAAFRMVKIVLEYNKSGLEFASGNGDYAEWLERSDINEPISAGDIVGVHGGKISRKLENAEQFMVVSYKPAVLGKAPEAKQAYKGNAVAFMGQIPVKVIGSVTKGDYIVPHPSITGYGQAIAPEQMTLLDHAQAVGRSWETDRAEGPKMVNTVVGVQNGDWQASVERVSNKQDQLDNKLHLLRNRLKAVQNKLDGTID